jgi:PAS domain S-box-containing protein
MPHRTEAAILELLKRLPVATVIADTGTGEILWANLRDLGIVAAESPSAVLGRNLLEFLDPTQHGVAIRDMEAIRRGESPPPLTYRIRRVDGGYSYVHIASIPMLYQETPAMLSCITDVTDREDMCRDLAESEERYRQLVEASPDGIAVVVGSEVVYANPALSRSIGLPADDDGRGRSFYDFVAAEFHEPIRAARRRILRTTSGHPAAEVVLVRADGSKLRAVAQTTAVRWSGELATQTVLHFLDDLAEDDAAPE